MTLDLPEPPPPFPVWALFDAGQRQAWLPPGASVTVRERDDVDALVVRALGTAPLVAPLGLGPLDAARDTEAREAPAMRAAWLVQCAQAWEAWRARQSRPAPTGLAMLHEARRAARGEGEGR
jgi:hypothetical protein